MNRTINHVINEIRVLEEELEALIEQQQQHFLYKVEGAKIEFEKTLLAKQKALKIGLIKWLRKSSIRSILSIPFIYAMIIPLSLLPPLGS